MLCLLNKDTVRLLCIVFDRLYVLRCLLVHGGATWNSRRSSPRGSSTDRVSTSKIIVGRRSRS